MSPAKRLLVVSAALVALLVAGVAVAQTLLGGSTDNSFVGLAQSTTNSLVTIATVPIYSGYCGTVDVRATGRLATAGGVGISEEMADLCCNNAGTVTCATEPAVISALTLGTPSGSIAFTPSTGAVLVGGQSVSSGVTMNWQVRGTVLFE